LGNFSGGNNRKPIAGSWRADTLANFELGWKSAWLDRRLRWNGAVFYEKWRDVQTSVQGQSVTPPVTASPPTQPRFGLHPDDTTPIPRPSHFYGRRQQNSMTELIRRDQGTAAVPAPVKIDKSQLAIAEPKRLRDKAHLKFVASQPCLICGRQPSDPHHLRFAQPRALGLKVSDEFTVPLCRGHHRQLHQAGKEEDWWKTFKVNALEIATSLWEQSHPSSIVGESVSDTKTV
jgi:hypothetical protein